MTKGNLEIHSENILPIIKKWLYSDKEIFVRELVSNACDAIRKVKILRDQGLAKAMDDEFRIDVTINKEQRTLSFNDTGVGMDAEEVVKYIAQIAFSGAEDFVEKYQNHGEGDQFIGHFGLGFYSSYMVADKVDINTLSYKEGAEPVFWSCDGSSQYILEKGTRTTRGTEVILHISANDDEFLEQSRIEGILRRYCSFLPYPIYLNGQKINENEPLWVKAPADCKPEDYLQFYRQLYPMEADPLFWIHLNVDYPFNVKGILYFPKQKVYFDKDKSTIQLYCNRVFVSDDCKDIIPDYLMPLRGVIDSPDIPLNVSRSYLQMDRTVRQLGNHISKKVSDSLANLYKNENQKFIDSWPDISVVVKLGAIEDEKFYERVKEFLLWKNTVGEWTTIESYLERNKEKTKDKIFYTSDDGHNSHFLDVFRQKGIEVLTMNQAIDNYVIHYLERKISPVVFQRVDAAIDENLIDAERENAILDEEGKTAAGRLADCIRSCLGDEHVEVEAKSIASENIPGFIVLDENQRRMRDYLVAKDPSQAFPAHMFGKRTFVVNTNSPLMGAIQKLNKSHPDLAKDLTKEAFDLALLSQREMDPKDLSNFIKRTGEIMEKLAEKVAS